MPRPREWYYPKRHELRRELVWQAGPWEAQYDRGVPQPPLPGKQAKAPLSPTSRLREGGVRPRQVLEDEAAGTLLKDPRKVHKGVVEEQVSSSTDPPESPVKKQSMATQRDASAGQRSARPRARNNYVSPLIIPTLEAVKFIENF